MEIVMTVDVTDRKIGEEIERARSALLRLAGEAPQRWWTAHELKVKARNGGSSAIMGLALSQLLEEGALEEGSDLRVRLPA
jgi:hypothetical protein